MDGAVLMPNVPNLIEALEAFAALLEKKKKKKHPEGWDEEAGAPPSKKKTRTILAAAFLGFHSDGSPVHPMPIREGDELYMQRTSEPGAGTLSLNRMGQPFGKALESLASGLVAALSVQLYYKRSVPDGDPCDECIENADAGWILVDEDYPNGEPGEVHPNCKCSEIYSDEGEGGDDAS